MVLICTVFARNLTKCGNKGKYGRQAARGQGLGGPYHAGAGGGLHGTRKHIYSIFKARFNIFFATTVFVRDKYRSSQQTCLRVTR